MFPKLHRLNNYKVPTTFIINEKQNISTSARVLKSKNVCRRNGVNPQNYMAKFKYLASSAGNETLNDKWCIYLLSLCKV